MSSPSVGRDEYINEYFTQREYGDFTSFYATIIICCVLVAALLILNLIFCCCSEHTDYWLDNNTGNRLIAPIWTRTPYKHPPLDYSELEGKAPPPPPAQLFRYPEPVEVTSHSSASTAAYSDRHQYYTAPAKRESDI